MKNHHTSFTLFLRILPVFLSGIMAAHAQNLTWQNAVSPATSTWSTNQSLDKNWKDDSNNTSYWVDGRDAIFDGDNQTITINGTVSVGNMTRVSGDSGHIVIDSGTIQLTDGSIISVSGNATNYLIIQSALSGTGGFVKQGTGGLRLEGNNNNLSGPVIINGSGATNQVTVAHSNALGTGNVTVNAGLLAIGQSQELSLTNNITLSGGTFSNSSSLGTGKTQEVLGKITLSTNSLIQEASASELRLAGGIEADNKTLTLRPTGNGFNGSITIATKPINLGSSGNLNLSGGETVAPETSVFTVNLNVSGNTFATVKVHNRTTLRLGVEDALPTDVALTVGNTHSATAGYGTVDLNGFNQTIGSLATLTHPSSADAINRVVTNSAAGIKTLTVNQSATTTYHGVLTGNLALTKSGSGCLTLTWGNSTYVGDTVISGGTLLLTEDAKLSGTPSIHIASGATFDVSGVNNVFELGSTQTLKGTGSVIGEMEILGTLAPGNSIGVISMEDLTIGSTGTLDIELGRSSGVPISDRVDVTGTVTVDSGANLKLTLYTGLDNPEQGDVFFLVNNDSTEAVSGVFTKLNGVNTTLNQGSVFSWNALAWEISYEADFGAQAFAGGNDIAIRVIPEPATWLLVGIGFGLILFRRPSRRHC